MSENNLLHNYRFLCITEGGQDLTFMDDANQDFLENSTTLINYEKMKMVSRRIKGFKDGLRAPYQFLPHETTQELWLTVEPWTDTDIFRVSKLREARAVDGATRVRHLRFDSKSFEKISKSILQGKGMVSTTFKLTKRDWDLVIACSRVVEYKKNQIVMEEGIYSLASFKQHHSDIDYEYRCGCN